MSKDELPAIGKHEIMEGKVWSVGLRIVSGKRKGNEIETA